MLLKSPTVICLLLAAAHAAPPTVKWTGWFSDSQCAASRAASGTFTATNPDCAKRCIEKGAAPVFISEQAKAIFQVKGYAAAVDDLGYRVELTGTLDDTGKIVNVQKVTRLEFQGAACARPKQKNH